MESYISALLKIIPKELAVLKRRYDILRGIKLFGPIGRRGLSDRINISEKHIRTETDFFKKEGFIKTTGTGMILTLVGEHLIDELKEFIEKIEGLSTVEAQVKEILGCEEVVIVPGDSDTDENAMHGIGHAAARKLLGKLTDGDIIAVTGGSTVQKVVEAIAPNYIKNENVTVVPARGSLGNIVSYQANTLAAMLAEKIQCNYRLLNIPDNLSQKALESVRQEPEIQNTIELLKQTKILLYGIGKADKMASRRHLGDEVMDMLQSKGAAAEAFGYYFGHDGEMIYAHESIGINIDQMTELKYPIAVAGGHSKSDAIYAVRKLLNRGCVIMDEGAARGLLDKVQ